MEVWGLIEWILKGFQGHKRLLVQTGDEFPKHLDFWNWEWYQWYSIHDHVAPHCLHTMISYHYAPFWWYIHIFLAKSILIMKKMILEVVSSNKIGELRNQLKFYRNDNSKPANFKFWEGFISCPATISEHCKVPRQTSVISQSTFVSTF